GAGRPTRGAECYRPAMGHMPQRGVFPNHPPARELFATMHELRGRHAPVRDDLIRVFSLDDHLDKPLRTLSGGTRQKVNACLALRFSPDLVILDEPTAGLDPRSSALLKDTVLSLRPSGVTTIVASHVMSELEELCDDIVFLLDGRVRSTGPISDLCGFTRQANLERAVAALMIREVA